MAKILIVDDAAFMRMSIQQMVEHKEHTVVGQAMDGVEAVEKFASLKPDVVLLDITMPRMDGVEALKQIKTIDPKAKVIICSAAGQQSMITKAIECGAETFIVKPFSEEQLLQAIDKAMQ